MRPTELDLRHLRDTLDNIATLADEWHLANWPSKGRDPVIRGLKLAEETGEVAEAIVKRYEGRPGHDGRRILEELADVIGVALAIAGTIDEAGITLGGALVELLTAPSGALTRDPAPHRGAELHALPKD